MSLFYIVSSIFDKNNAFIFSLIPSKAFSIFLLSQLVTLFCNELFLSAAWCCILLFSFYLLFWVPTLTCKRQIYRQHQFCFSIYEELYYLSSLFFHLLPHPAPPLSCSSCLYHPNLSNIIRLWCI